MTNPVVEKLAAIEKEVAAIQPRIEPMAERIDALHQKASAFARQLADIAADIAAVKQEVDVTRQGFDKIQALISESRVESEQLVAGQEENIQRCETMTAVFGAAFQAVSQFFETAQRMGLADQAKAVFLAPASVPTAMTIPTGTVSAPSISEPLPPEESVIQEESVIEKLPAIPELPAELPPAPVLEPPPAAESAAVLSEEDFDAMLPKTEDPSINSWGVPPGLPVMDAAALESVDDHDQAANEEPASEMASELDVPPLNLSAPTLDESPIEETADEQDIEDLLATMMAPVTAGNGA